MAEGGIEAGERKEGKPEEGMKKGCAKEGDGVEQVRWRRSTGA